MKARLCQARECSLGRRRRCLAATGSVGATETTPLARSARVQEDRCAISARGHSTSAMGWRVHILTSQRLLRSQRWKILVIDASSSVSRPAETHVPVSPTQVVAYSAAMFWPVRGICQIDAASDTGFTGTAPLNAIVKTLRGRDYYQ
jgi:hypothetical protein